MKEMLFNTHGKLIDVKSPQIMGILNLTPDSFSDGGKFNTEKSALLHAEKMIKEGALIIDIGAQSTNPGSNLISASEEIARLGKIIARVKMEFPEIIISLDTFYAEVVEYGFNEGIDWVNDISGGQYDPEMFNTVAKKDLVYILTHCNPSYEIMHQKIEHNDIIVEINRYLFEKIEKLNSLGVKDIIIDPGFGFGKTLEDQKIIFDEIQHVGLGIYPILMGISKKSWIYQPINKKPTDIVLETAILHYKALENGVDILRVHDVSETMRVLNLYHFLSGTP